MTSSTQIDRAAAAAAPFAVQATSTPNTAQTSTPAPAAAEAEAPQKRSPRRLRYANERGETVFLTEREIRLIERLAAAENETVGSEALLREVFGYHPDAQTHTLATHVWRLRRKIEPNPKAPRHLVFDDGGYRLTRAALWRRVLASA